MEPRSSAPFDSHSRLVRISDIRQRTWGEAGHFLNHRQAQSHCGNFLVYDTRNKDPDIGKTRRIESLDLRDGKIQTIYDTGSESDFGPGVGAVVCHPLRRSVLFIHGVAPCTEQSPYSITRRFGAMLEADLSNSESKWQAFPMESRSTQTPMAWGSLSGGTHAHSFSPDGRWVSFTYNDCRVAGRVPALDRRTVGFAILDERKMNVLSFAERPFVELGESFIGAAWSGVIVDPVEEPVPGSDMLDWAREECWLPDPDQRRLVFIGRVRVPAATASGYENIEELFEAEFPRDAEEWPNHLRGEIPLDAETGRLQPPPGIRIRRLTYSMDQQFPGIRGPRHWPVADPRNRFVVVLMQDNLGIIRAVRISTASGGSATKSSQNDSGNIDSRNIAWITKNRESITHPLAIDSTGRYLSVVVGKRLFIHDLEAGVETEIPWDSQRWDEIVGPVQFLKGGRGLFWNARLLGSPWLQIWTADLQY